jgi:hypothetical protein
MVRVLRDDLCTRFSWDSGHGINRIRKTYGILQPQIVPRFLRPGRLSRLIATFHVADLGQSGPPRACLDPVTMEFVSVRFSQPAPPDDKVRSA